MGFFSKLADPLGVHSGSNPIQREQKEQAQASVDQGMAAAALKREQFDLLREDAAPLRSLRNENINRLLKLQGIGGAQDISSFNVSPEFTTVRDAALQVQGGNARQSEELAERANQLGQGEFGNFSNRIFNTAGFSSSGLANTNSLLQQNVDAQANLLNQAGSQAASGLIAGANQRGQAASGVAGLIGAFSDIRLKDNIQKIGYYEDLGIYKYRWTWKDKAKAIVGDQINEGPIAQDVQKVMPDNVHEVDGCLAIIDMGRIK